ncbi:hypothetical protein LCGC14_0366630 [marine sediment metagenome]|uniref:Sulfotransferase domain-containing protein n=1 Tax=marine sediment metagenome TaxID=412755 RepID=A0A0F9VTL9_9ZZZZ|nr:sulfotransferase [Phycisphaerae bacterium]
MFAGPVFIVGVPRSGTTMLRDLLGSHPDIAFPYIESGFIPRWVRRFGRDVDLTDPARMKRFYEALIASPFYRRGQRYGYRLMFEDLDRIEDKRSWASIFEFLLRAFCPDGFWNGRIFGDKTPDYLLHLPLLGEVFPEARFIHIVRDPRDVASSHAKRWNKSPTGTASRWVDDIRRARREASRHGLAYTEVRYEALLDDPVAALGELCEFLSCEFAPHMLRMTKASSTGDTKGRDDIVAGNQGKYLDQMSAAAIRRVEEITWPLLTELSYPAGHADRHRPLNPMMRFVLRKRDWLAFMTNDQPDVGWAKRLRTINPVAARRS